MDATDYHNHFGWYIRFHFEGLHIHENNTVKVVS